MAIRRIVRTGAAAALLTTATACASPGLAAPATPTTAADVVPADPDTVVLLQVQAVGGDDAARLAVELPSLVVYADGRVFTPAPVITIAPGPALPAWNLQRIDPAEIQGLIDRARAAGTDGMAALGEDLLDGGQPWAPAAVAAVVEPWADLPDRPAHADARWVGPSLPGEPFGEGFGCVTATGDEAQAVLDAAGSATAATPWVSGDGSRWAVTFRPLLPHENGCADLLG